MEIVMKTYVSPQEQKRDSNVSRMTTRVDKSVHDVVARAAKIGGLSISKRTAQQWRDNNVIFYSQIGNKIFYLT